MLLLRFVNRRSFSTFIRITTSKDRQHYSQKQHFVDRLKVDVTGGHGGSGAITHDCMGRNKRPTGEKGGDGGSIILKGCPDMDHLRFTSMHLVAGRGGNGGANYKTGARGKNVITRVPIGTVVHEILNEKELTDDDEGDGNIKGKMVLEYETRLLADIDQKDMEVVVACGGKGGLGNCVLRTPERRKQLPDYSPAGTAGEHRQLLLELKSIADIGLVGFPNAGKSSLLTAISNATPKIAAYPFTTLHPHLGVVSVGDAAMNTFTMADLPGLIEGAHENVGLGFEFLRHIERTKALLYVIDVAGSEGRDPAKDFEVLQHELRCYSPSLLKRPSFVFANKIDLGETLCRKHIERIQATTDLPVVVGSAVCKTGLPELVQLMWNVVRRRR